MAKKYNSKHNKRVRNLVAICALCAIVLTVSTYAWFIGMKTVSVNSFDIEIASTEGLFLSMDGENWTYNLDAKNAKAYTGNTNQWLDGENEGLIPMSSVGDMDNDASRMILFEKASLTGSDKFSGMRLLSSRVKNYKDGETLMKGDGYVAFDLFIKNLSGEEYYVDNNPLNEEAIYLRDNSKVIASGTGTDIDKTGIENSVRVAFAQIGRVKNTESTEAAEISKITGITCKTEGDVTGICRQAQIWEPNDTKHVANAIAWYNKSCKKRTGESVVAEDSYTAEACSTIVDGTAYPTYAVANELTVTDKAHSNVNIYDGAEYNGYTTNTTSFADYTKDGADKTTAKLVAYNYFKDSDKIKNGTERPTFMTLAPNSITKVRVYIWLEGQDIDNYDFASLGQQISVNFGFTKERFEQNEDEKDFPDYNGPDIPETTNDPAKPVPTNEPTPAPGA